MMEELVYKQKDQCRLCLGSFCEHGKKKWNCKVCGGSGLCEHGSLKYDCRPCGGKGYCEHGKRRRTCKECDGTGHCEQGNVRARCKECGGTGLCEHRLIKYNCKPCGGGAYCQHGKNKRNCRECGGKDICDHDKIRRLCLECGGSAMCEHGIKRYVCKVCRGAGICEHDTYKHYCKPCGGKGLCKHDLHRSQCADCGNPPMCDGCGLYIMPRRGHLCQFCNPRSQRRSVYDAGRAENQVNTYLAQNLEDTFTTYAIGTYAPFRSCGNNKRPDKVVRREDFMGIIETDENCHGDDDRKYTTGCEWVKALGHGQSSLQTEGINRVAFFRFNPDAWTVDGKTKRCGWEIRMRLLKKLIIKAFQDQTEAFIMSMLYYPSIEPNPVQEVSLEMIEEWMETLTLYDISFFLLPFQCCGDKRIRNEQSPHCIVSLVKRSPFQ
ncbi:hypothetical protein DFS34DRAFT_671390 [Phlyctochytrium arcticum]|nr:hypothetical protein DFS34DRAFT_671390 [Phlyctochytrium arcticum]